MEGLFCGLGMEGTTQPLHGYKPQGLVRIYTGKEEKESAQLDARSDARSRNREVVFWVRARDGV